MKILLTGEPGCGKTTLLQEFLEAVTNKQGFVAREVRSEGSRVGFKLVSSSGQTALLASVASTSKLRVSKYGVELEALDGFLSKLPVVESYNLLYVDEIGQMQLFSDNFKMLIMSYLNEPNMYMGTITGIYGDEFTKQILAREDIILLKINLDNREQVREVLSSLATNLELLDQLSAEIQDATEIMAREYAKTSSFIQLKKLFGNAVKYIAEGRVNKVGDGIFVVRGNKDSHTVIKTKRSWACDCDLFAGRGIYVGKPGTCSHIQSVTLGGLDKGSL